MEVALVKGCPNAPWDFFFSPAYQELLCGHVWMCCWYWFLGRLLISSSIIRTRKKILGKVATSSYNSAGQSWDKEGRYREEWNWNGKAHGCWRYDIVHIILEPQLFKDIWRNGYMAHMSVSILCLYATADNRKLVGSILHRVGKWVMSWVING